MQKTTTFLMFVGEQCGKAEEAIKFYVSLFRDSEVKTINYYGEGEPGGKAGQVKMGLFSLAGLEYMAIDSAFQHAFNFTPSVSIFVQCDNEEEMESLYQKFADKGKVMMPMGAYGFSKKFAWLSDRYGVSWQLNLK